MKTSTDRTEIEALEQQIVDMQKQLAKLRREQPPERVADYELTEWPGVKVRLSELFGDKDELIVVHNMGKQCSYCTLWADSFIGITKHLEDRAAFVVTTPNDPETQRQFARDRGWNFRMLSTEGTTFKHDMGFEPEPRRYEPGVSIFRKNASGSSVDAGFEIEHVSKAAFGPGDAYCSVWHFLDLLPSERDWHPKYNYSEAVKKDLAHS
ncbi:MAG: DUF899 family protein [Bacteroidota bacterium]|nr:DUF899 family protein [Bacteroidota bacterium]MDP4231759.1 DUF899 family protein [Bacteroidota bacterium]MDP4243495.1 DUF899 family protein [Bacteroidota bacterium]MDP4287096.1 DUF899 family protein [Bacteroidota bacterium]